MDVLPYSANIEQPPVYSFDGRNELMVAVASLSLGGAERIVLDWAARIHPRWRVHLIVLRDRDKEWHVPSYIRVTRVEKLFIAKGGRITDKDAQRLGILRSIGAEIAKNVIPVCTCHLLREDERNALGESGATIITVLHNAKDGWLEDVTHLNATSNTIAVSDACLHDLRNAGFGGPVSVIRHIPTRRRFAEDAREHFRTLWNIPQDAVVIGMIGAVKLQKNYLRALRVFKALRQKIDAYLVIVGGPVNILAEGRAQWTATVNEVKALDLRKRVAMPGFVPDAAQCLPAFDLVLNTSDYEGMSIATLEVLQSGLPTVASKVGGQGEITSPGLTLIPTDSEDTVWVDAIIERLGQKFEPPAWASFPSYRLWTLAGLTHPIVRFGKKIFVTSNLNSGGAQRSLVNLTTNIIGKENFEVVVAGDSTSSYFYRRLRSAGVRVVRSGECSDAFSHAETLVHKICADDIETVCFWNVDRKVKLLVVKALASTTVRCIDVSPGGYSFDEMDESDEFRRLIAFSSEEYYQRLDTLVLKYDGPYPPECEGKVVVIKNGVPLPVHMKRDYSIRENSRVVVNGRIAPSKFLEEIIEAMRIVRESIADAELHIFGGAEECEQEYLQRITAAARASLGTGVQFYGTNFEVVSRLSDFDAQVVLGKHQGCPNALLEALSVGLPVVANDDGGTREQVINGKTGLLVHDCSPQAVATALIRILSDRKLAERLGIAGREHVERYFSMREMTDNYLQLLTDPIEQQARLREAVA